MAAIGNSPTQQAFTPAIDYFSGNGSTTAFTLSRPVASVAQVQVTIDNVAQNPSSAYTVSANTLTFTSAPLSGTNNIYVYYTSPITQVIAPGQGTVTATSMASSTGTGAGVFQTSPTLVTPVLGVASATSITVAAGAVGTPSITTAGDTNTGIFFPAADTIAFSEGGAEAMRIDSSGNVGIGTASPVSKLNVNGGSVTLAETTTGAYNIDFQSRTASTNARIQYDQLTNTTGQLLFYTNGGSLTERMRINSAGNLYVNTTTGLSPDNAFISVAGSSSIPGLTVLGGAGPWAIKVGTVDTTSTRYMIGICNNSGATLGGITTNGTVITYGGTSDYRLKENIQPLSAALEKIAQLKPVTYTWKSTGAAGNGFIAHELAEVFPDAVAGEKDALEENGSIKAQMIDPSKLVATLTAALQETKALIDTQAETLSQQAETIDALTARVTALENR